MPRSRSRSREPGAGTHPENTIRGYKAYAPYPDFLVKKEVDNSSALKNPNVSDQAKQHAQQELDKYESGQGGPEEDRHASNVKRGLKAYVVFLMRVEWVAAGADADAETGQRIIPTLRIWGRSRPGINWRRWGSRLISRVISFPLCRSKYMLYTMHML